MNILFVTPYLPDPPHSGARRRMHGLITGLARSHAVSILSLVEPGPQQAEAIAATRAYCTELVTVDDDHYRLTGRQKRLLQLKSMFSPFSYERLFLNRPALQASLDQMIQRQRYDIINIEFPRMALYHFATDSTLVLDEHNIEYEIRYRTYKVESRLERRLYNYINYRKLRREEHHAWRKVDGCVLTSGRDEQLLRRDVPEIPTTVVPNGVDTEFFRPSHRPSEPLTLLFFGALDYHPNVEGLLFFLRSVMPRLRQRYASVTLFVVGPAPPEAIRRWASADVIITGLVDDVRPYLERARAVIVPLRIGGGTRLKILEAMAMGKAVVSTTIGAEGIDVADGEDILLADTDEAFANQVSRLLDDAALASRLGSAARRLVENCYDWRTSAHKLESFYERLRVAGRS